MQCLKDRSRLQVQSTKMPMAPPCGGGRGIPDAGQWFRGSLHTRQQSITFQTMYARGDFLLTTLAMVLKLKPENLTMSPSLMMGQSGLVSGW